MSVESRATRAASQAARVAEASSVLNAAVEKKAKMILLDMMMPNGKALRDCSSEECEAMGDWFIRLAGRIRA